MAAPFWWLEEKLEDALVSLLQKQVGGMMNVYCGFDSDDITLPCVVVSVPDSDPSNDEEGEVTGVIDCEVLILVQSPSDPEKDDAGNEIRDARHAHALRFASVLDLFYTQSRIDADGNPADNIVDMLNTQPISDFSADYVIPGKRSRDVDENNFETEVEITIGCKPCDVP